jgi:hypothetical protein
MKFHLCLLVVDVMSFAMVESVCAENSANSASQMAQHGSDGKCLRRPLM